MSIDLEGLERSARDIAGEHRAAINESESIATKLAKADAVYHRELATQIALAKMEHGSTVAETLAKGTTEVTEAKEARDILTAKDRATMERIRLSRDDRQALLAIAGWSKANESAYA